MMEGSYASHPKDLDVLDAIFTRPDLTTFARLDDLGLEVVAAPGLHQTRGATALGFRDPPPPHSVSGARLWGAVRRTVLARDRRLWPGDLTLADRGIVVGAARAEVQPTVLGRHGDRVPGGDLAVEEQPGELGLLHG